MNKLLIYLLISLGLTTVIVGAQRTAELKEACNRQEVGPGRHVLMEPRGEWFRCI